MPLEHGASKVKNPNNVIEAHHGESLMPSVGVIVAIAQAVCPIGHSSSFLLRTTRKQFFAADAVLL